LDAEPELQTARLRLRRWTEADREPFAALNADPVVMEYFPDLLTRQQSDSLIESIESGFEQVALEQIVSFASVGNMRSRAVMERIGMTRSPDDDFEHPGLPVAHPLRRHVLYRIGRASAEARGGGHLGGNICSSG